jgi:hypothetical protein
MAMGSVGPKDGPGLAARVPIAAADRNGEADLDLGGERVVVADAIGLAVDVVGLLARMVDGVMCRSLDLI